MASRERSGSKPAAPPESKPRPPAKARPEARPTARPASRRPTSQVPRQPALRAKNRGEQWILSVDIGGTGVKAALIDGTGALITDRLRIETPVGAPPSATLERIKDLVRPWPGFDRIAVGFPGVIADGRVLTAPNLGHRGWLGFDLARALTATLRKPARVSNDAALQGLAVIRGKGIELLITLGTGVGSALFYDGLLMPQFTLGHYVLKKTQTYDERLNARALRRVGAKRWSRRLQHAIASLGHLVAYDHLYLGGGNAKKIRFPPDERTTVVSNEAGVRGGAVLWRNGTRPAG
jgi:polyphosphate glucokinase